MTNDASTAAEATMPASCLPQRLRKKIFSSAPASGSSAIQGRRFVVMASARLPLQELHVPGIERLAVAKHRDEDCQADDGFGGGDRHDEEDDDLPFQRAEKSREGDEREIDGIEHELDRHEDHDDVAPYDDAGDADREQHRAQNQIVFQRRRRHRCLCASATAPTIATSSRTDAISNGSAKSVKSVCAIACGPPKASGTAGPADGRPPRDNRTAN